MAPSLLNSIYMTTTVASISTKAADWTDVDLLARVLRNDARGWSELVRRYRPLVYRCIAKVTSKYGAMSAVDSDEIYAEVMMQLVRDEMRKLRMYDSGRGTKLGSWIGMIAVNAAYDHLRSAGRRPLLAADDEPLNMSDDDDRTPLDSLLEKERWAHFTEMLTEFTDKDRTFVHLYFQRGLEPEVVADQMQISLKTVYSKKHKIRAHLVRCLEKLRGDSPIADLAAVAA